MKHRSKHVLNRLLVFLLTGSMVMSASTTSFADVTGEQQVVEQETKAPETKAPETETLETKASGTVQEKEKKAEGEPAAEKESFSETESLTEKSGESESETEESTENLKESESVSRKESEAETEVSEETTAGETEAAAETVPETVAEETKSAESLKPAFSESRTIDGVVITVTAEEGVFPADAKLIASKVLSSAVQDKVDEAVADEKESKAAEDEDKDENVAASFTYDIKVVDEDGNEIQPEDGQIVQVSFRLVDELQEDAQVEVYHVHEDEAGELNAEPLTAEVSGDTVTTETDGFSYYQINITTGTVYVATEDELKTAIENATGTEENPTEIYLTDNIPLKEHIEVPNGKHICLTSAAGESYELYPDEDYNYGGTVYNLLTIGDENASAVNGATVVLSNVCLNGKNDDIFNDAKAAAENGTMST